MFSCISYFTHDVSSTQQRVTKTEISQQDQLNLAPCSAACNKPNSLIQIYKLNTLSFWVAAGDGVSPSERMAYLSQAFLYVGLCVCLFSFSHHLVRFPGSNQQDMVLYLVYFENILKQNTFTPLTSHFLTILSTNTQPYVPHLFNREERLQEPNSEQSNADEGHSVVHQQSLCSLQAEAGFTVTDGFSKGT